MSSLRWVLLGLGVLLLALIYLWGRGMLRRPLPSFRKSHSRIEPSLADRDASAELGDDSPEQLSGFVIDAESEPDALDHDAYQWDDKPEPDFAAAGDDAPSDAADPAPLPEADRIVTVRLGPTEQALNGQDVVLALRAAGLRHGRYGIFHLLDDSGSDEPLFSVANLTEPGSFDLNRIADTSIPGVSFFMILPGIGDPVERFDRMVDTARALAREWDAELHDERGSSWSIQRERYVREEIIQYRHQLYRA